MEDVVAAQAVPESIKVNYVLCVSWAKWICGHKVQMINIIYLHSCQQRIDILKQQSVFLCKQKNLQPFLCKSSLLQHPALYVSH